MDLLRLLQLHYHPHSYVVNTGVPGWDLPIELAYLEETGLCYEPDVIIVELTVANDIYHTIYQIPSPSLITWLQANTSTWGMLSMLFSPLRSLVQNRGVSPFPPPYPFPLDENDPIWDEYVRVPLVKMAHVARQHHADFLLIVFPTDAQVRDPAYPRTPQRVVQQLAAQNDWLWIDLWPLFRQVYADYASDPENATNPLYADHSSHPSVLGHRLAAQVIFEMLESQGLLRTY